METPTNRYKKLLAAIALNFNELTNDVKDMLIQKYELQDIYE